MTSGCTATQPSSATSSNNATYGEQHVQLAVRVSQLRVRQDRWLLTAIQFNPLAADPTSPEDR